MTGISVATLADIQHTRKCLANIVSDKGIRAHFLESAKSQNYHDAYGRYLQRMKTPSFSWKPDGIDENIWHATYDPLTKGLPLLELQILRLRHEPQDQEATAMLIVLMHNLKMNLKLVAHNGERLFNMRGASGTLSKIWPELQSVRPDKIETPQKLFAVLKNQFAPNVHALNRIAMAQSGVTYDGAVKYLREHGEGQFVDHLQGRDTFLPLQVTPLMAA